MHGVAERDTTGRGLVDVRYSRSAAHKAAICTAIYPGATILLSLAIQWAPLSEASKALPIKVMRYVLWPVRAIVMGLLELIDRAGPPNLDEPVSMFLPQWQFIGLILLAVLVIGTLVFASSLTIFRWLQSGR